MGRAHLQKDDIVAIELRLRLLLMFALEWIAYRLRFTGLVWLKIGPASSS
jgi:hypothetical protein